MNERQLRTVMDGKKYGSSLVEWVIAFYPMMTNLFGEEKVDEILKKFEFELIKQRRQIIGVIY